MLINVRDDDISDHVYIICDVLLTVLQNVYIKRDKGKTSFKLIFEK